MKRILLVLFISAITIPARAEALVYTMKNKNVRFTNDSQGPKMVKENATGYVIFEASPGAESCNMWVITTQNYGGIKYAGVESQGTLSVFVKGKKMVINDATGSRSVFLTGRAKTITINGKKFDVAGKLTGLLIWDYVDSYNPGPRDVGCEQVTLSFDTKLTAVCKDYGGEAATQAIMTYLKFVDAYNLIP